MLQRLAQLTRRFQPEAVEEVGVTRPSGMEEREGFGIEEFVEAQARQIKSLE